MNINIYNIDVYYPKTTSDSGSDLCISVLFLDSTFDPPNSGFRWKRRGNQFYINISYCTRIIKHLGNEVLNITNQHSFPIDFSITPRVGFPGWNMIYSIFCRILELSSPCLPHWTVFKTQRHSMKYGLKMVEGILTMVSDNPQLRVASITCGRSSSTKLRGFLRSNSKKKTRQFFTS